MQPDFVLQGLRLREHELAKIETTVAGLDKVLLADNFLIQEKWAARRRHLPMYPAQPVRGENNVAVCAF